MADETTSNDETRTTRRKVRRCLVISTKMDKTVVGGRGQARGAPPLRQDMQRTKPPLRARREQRGSRGRPRARLRDATRSRSRSTGASRKSWSVPGDPAGESAQWWPTTRVPARCSASRCSRYPPALRRHRRHLRRHGEGRGARAQQHEEGRRSLKCVVVRTKKERRSPDGKLHPLRRERGGAHQRPDAAAWHAIFGPVGRELRDRRFMRIVLAWHRRCCEHGNQGQAQDEAQEG